MCTKDRGYLGKWLSKHDFGDEVGKCVNNNLKQSMKIRWDEKGLLKWWMLIGM